MSRLQVVVGGNTPSVRNIPLSSVDRTRICFFSHCTSNRPSGQRGTGSVSPPPYSRTTVIGAVGPSNSELAVSKTPDRRAFDKAVASAPENSRGPPPGRWMDTFTISALAKCWRTVVQTSSSALPDPVQPEAAAKLRAIKVNSTTTRTRQNAGRTREMQATLRCFMLLRSSGRSFCRNGGTCHSLIGFCLQRAGSRAPIPPTRRVRAARSATARRAAEGRTQERPTGSRGRSSHIRG